MTAARLATNERTKPIRHQP